MAKIEKDDNIYPVLIYKNGSINYFKNINYSVTLKYVANNGLISLLTIDNVVITDIFEHKNYLDNNLYSTNINLNIVSYNKTVLDSFYKEFEQYFKKNIKNFKKLKLLSLNQCIRLMKLKEIGYD